MTMPMTATALAAAVRAGTVTPREAVAASLARIAASDGVLHAFARVRAEAALAEADEVGARADLARLPLAGVPVAVKDCLAIAAEPMRVGSLASDPTPQTKDDDLVTRLRGAGAIVVGVAACPEAMLWPTTDAPDAVTRNPWDHMLSAGGSSGGSAAAVAATFVPIAHGTDGLGSIRIPAAVCGVVGVKPGWDVVTPYDSSPEAWYGLAEHGPIAATVDDAALALSVLAARPDLAAPQADVTDVRVGVAVRAPLQGVATDPDVVRLTFGAAAALRRAGARIQRQRIAYPKIVAWAGLVRWFAVAVPAVDAATDPALLQRRTLVHGRIGRAARHAVRDADAQAWRRRALDLFEATDVLMTPVLATAALPAHTWSLRSWSANVASALLSSGGFTAPWNLAGFPTVAVPAGRHPRTGAPVGVQLVGPPSTEARLLAVAAGLERERPWPPHALSAPTAPRSRPGG